MQNIKWVMWVIASMPMLILGLLYSKMPSSSMNLIPFSIESLKSVKTIYHSEKSFDYYQYVGIG